MTLHSEIWLRLRTFFPQAWAGRQRRRPARPQVQRLRPVLDALEDRTLLATLATPVLFAPTGPSLNASPVFAWSQVSGATTYELRVDDTTTGMTQVVHQNIAAPPAPAPPAPPINPTSPAEPVTPGDSFAWWVRAFDNSGNQSAWSVTGTFSVPLLSAPLVLNTSPSGPIQTAAPTFAWSSVAAANHYELWVSDATTGQSQVLDNSNIATTSFTVVNPLPSGDTFNWWVRSLSTNGDLSPWAGGSSFTVVRPDAPIPIGPTGTIAIVTTMFSWNPNSSDAHDFWMEDVSTGAGPVRSLKFFGYPTFSFERGHVYRWWVRTDGNGGDTSLWSAETDFQVALGAPPTLIDPHNHSDTFSWKPAFTWSAVPGADRYDLSVDDTTTGQAAVVRNTAISGTSFTPTTPLTPTHTYRWWVRAYVINGLSTDWSAPQSFTVRVLLSPISATGPSGASTNATPTFSGTGYVPFYDVWVSDVTAGIAQVLRNPSINGTFVSADDTYTFSYAFSTALTPGHSYVWWIRDLGSDGNPSPWSAGTPFSVTPLAAPTGLASFPHSRVPFVIWNAIAPVTDFFDVWVDDVTSGQSQAFRNQQVAQVVGGTSAVAEITTALTPGHIYQWWVRVFNVSGDYSDWSTSTFTA